MGSNASKSAAQAQVDATNKASETQQAAYQQIRQDLSPWVTGGNNALSSLQSLYGIGTGGQGAGSPVLSALGIGAGGGQATATTPFQSSPGYQFQKQEGLNSIINSTANKGGLGGNTLKELTKYGTNVANQDYYNYLTQLNNAWNSLTGGLSNLSSQGQSAAAGVGNAGLSTSNNISSNQIGAGNATASGIMGSNNSLTGGINSALSTLYQQFNSPNGLFGYGGNQTNTGRTSNSLNYGYDPYQGLYSGTTMS
jgi:hypothetical protein